MKKISHFDKICLWLSAGCVILSTAVLGYAKYIDMKSRADLAEERRIEAELADRP